MARAATTTDAFNAIAEPRRREILGLLADGEGRAVNDLVDEMRLPQPAVSKHLGVLRKVGLVSVDKDGQRRLYRLKPEPFEEVDAWLEPFRRFWSAHLDALERHLDRMEQASSTKGTKKGKKQGKKR